MEKEEVAALLNETLSEISRRFDGLETRFDGLETRFDGLETRFDGLEGRFNYVDSEVGKLRVDSHEMKNMLQRNNELIHAVDEKLERFRDETMDNLIDIRSDLTISFKLLNKRVTDLENRQV